MSYVLPALFLFVVCYGKIKKVNVYEGFACGAKKGLELGFEIFPFVLCVLAAVALFRASGLLTALVGLVQPVFSALAIPSELCELVVLKPFSGSGSLAVLADIFKTYGADSYVARCAAAIAGCSETTFYVACIYTSKCQVKRLGYAIPVSLVASLVGCIVACLVCKVL